METCTIMLSFNNHAFEDTNSVYVGLALIGLSFIAILLKSRSSTGSRKYDKMVEGPSVLEFVTTLADLGAVITAIEEWSVRYGDLFIFGPSKLLFFFPPPVVITDRELCEEILVRKANYYRKGDTSFGRTLVTQQAQITAFGTCVAALVGEPWAWRKNALLGEFQTSKLLLNDAKLFEEIVKGGQKLCKSLSEAADKGTPVPLLSLVQEATVDIIMFMLFGKEIPCSAEDLLEANDNMLAAFTWKISTPVMAWIPTRKRKEALAKKHAAWSFFNKIFRKEVEAIIREVKGEPRDPQRHPYCLIERLIEKEPKFLNGGIDDLMGDIRLLINAGYETSAATMSFAVGMTADPRYNSGLDDVAVEAQKVMKECGGVPTRDTLKDLKLNTGLFMESLRLFPVIPLLSGECSADMEINKDGKTYQIKKGVNIFFNAGVINVRDCKKYTDTPEIPHPELWDKPAKDQPWLGSFNLGAHHCPGKFLAFLEGKIFLAMALAQFKFSLPPGVQGIDKINRGLQIPKDGMPLIVTRRED